MIQSILRKLAHTRYVQSAVAEQADLGAFRERPTPRVISGLWIIGLSYLIGWPAVGALGMVSVYWKNPLIITIGGPLVYGLSHLVFMVGVYFAGAGHARVFMKWAARMAMERWMGDDLAAPSGNGSPDAPRKNASGP